MDGSVMIRVSSDIRDAVNDGAKRLYMSQGDYIRTLLSGGLDEKRHEVSTDYSDAIFRKTEGLEKSFILMQESIERMERTLESFKYGNM